MHLNRPKRLILKISTYFSIISCVLAIIAVLIFYSWKTNKLNFIFLDLEIRNHYTENINSIKNEILNSTSEDSKFNYYIELLSELEGATFLHKFYTLNVEANKFVIDYLITKGQEHKAEEIALKWLNSNPYDFSAKYQYANILKNRDINLSLNFYKKLYDKHRDMHLLISDYIDTLLSNGSFKEALTIINESQERLIDNTVPSFKLYFKDFTRDTYSYLNSFEISRDDISESNDNFTMTFHKSIESFHGLRFYIGNLKQFSTIHSLIFTFKTKDKKFENVAFVPINDIKRKIDDSFDVDGLNPGFEIEIPKYLSGYSGILQINISMVFRSNKHHEISKILLHPSWAISYSKNSQFNETDSERFYFESEKNIYSSALNPPKSGINYMKIKFPSFINMDIKNLVLYSLDTEISTSIIESHNVVNKEDSIVITHENAFIILKLNNEEHLENLRIKFRF